LLGIESTKITSGEVEIFSIIDNYIHSIIDVGTRTDTFYCLYNRSKHPEREVVMFEPNKFFQKILRKKISNLPGKNTLLPLGLCDREEEVYYFHSSQSFVQNWGGGGRYKESSLLVLIPLDTLSHKFSSIDFLKIDTEGMDYLVLKGAKKILETVKFLQFEIGGWNSEYDDRRFTNKQYWELLEKDFHLYLLKDEGNPIWSVQNKLLLNLDANLKTIIDLLAKSKVGVNIFGISKVWVIPDELLEEIGFVST